VACTSIFERKNRGDDLFFELDFEAAAKASPDSQNYSLLVLSCPTIRLPAQTLHRKNGFIKEEVKTRHQHAKNSVYPLSPTPNTYIY
jgi:guanylate kinase